VVLTIRRSRPTTPPIWAGNGAAAYRGKMALFPLSRGVGKKLPGRWESAGQLACYRDAAYFIGTLSYVFQRRLARPTVALLPLFYAMVIIGLVPWPPSAVPRRS
jgi:hypothetical protein